jgi:hypothetical protein
MAEYSLGDLIVNVGASIDGFSAAMNQVSDQLKETDKLGEEFAEGMTESFKKVAEAAGLAFTAFEVGKESLEAFSKSQDVISSFTLLTGNAEDAQAAFEGLKETSQELAVPFENLVSVAQRLAPVFGVGTEAMKEVVTAAADVAAATGRSFDSVASGLERIGLTGQVTSRQLLALGVSMGDIATYMGVSIADATALLKKGGEDAQDTVAAVTGAVEAKFGGAAETIGQNLSGQFTKLKNELGFVFEEIGSDLAPIASGVLEAFSDALPYIHSFVDSLSVAASGVLELGSSLRGLVGIANDSVGDVKAVGEVQLSFWQQVVFSLGTAVGIVGALAAGVVDLVKGLVLAARDAANILTPGGSLSDKLKQFAKDWHDTGDTMVRDFTTNLKAITDKADQLTLNVKIPVAGDTVVSEGERAAKPDYAANLAALEALKGAKATLTETTKLLTQADKDWEDFQKTTYIPTLLSVADATANVQTALENYQAAELAEANARQELAIKPSDIALQDALKEAEKAGADAKRNYTEAVKDQSVAKATLATVTKDLQSAEDAIAAATKASYVPALLDHQTALDNIATAQSNQVNAIQNVLDAEAHLKEVYGQTIKTTDEVKAAEDALEATKKQLALSTTALTQAHNDEKASLSALTAAAKEVDADEKAAIDTRKLLYGSTTDISTALGDYETALENVKAASDKLADAETTLILAKAGNDMQAVTDATNAAKLARDGLAVSTKGLSDATGVLTGTFKVNAEVMSLLNQNTKDWAAANLAAQVAMTELGVKSSAVLDDIAAKSKAAYDKVKDNANASNQDKLQSDIKYLTDRNAAEAQSDAGLSAAHALELAAMKQKEADYQADSVQGWATLFTSIDSTVKGTAQSMIHTLLTGTGSFGDEAKKMLTDIGEEVVTKFTKPFTDAIASLISGAITDLLSGKGLGGISSALDSIAKKIPGLGGLFGGGIGAPGTGAIGDVVGNGDTLAGVGGSPASAASAAVSSSLTSIMGLVSGAVSAISGVVGIFQNMHQETSLNAIEENTRLTALAMVGAWQTAGGDSETMFAFTKLTSQYTSHLPPMRAALDQINGHMIESVTYLSQLAAGNSGSSAAQAMGQSVSDATGWDSPLVTAIGYLHTDLVGIWATVHGAGDHLEWIANHMGAGNAGITLTSANGGLVASGTVDPNLQLPGLEAFINGINERVAAGAINAKPEDAQSTLDLLSSIDKTLSISGQSAMKFFNDSITIASSVGESLFAVLQSGFQWVVKDIDFLNDGLKTSLQSLTNSLNKVGAITVTVQGNVIGNTDFVNQVASAVAVQIRQQGSYA